MPTSRISWLVWLVDSGSPQAVDELQPCDSDHSAARTRVPPAQGSARRKSVRVATGSAESRTARVTSADTAGGAAAAWRSSAVQLEGVTLGSIDVIRSSKQTVNPLATVATTGAGSPAWVSSVRRRVEPTAADGAALWASTVKNTTPIRATPRVAPSCWVVDSTPDAEPAALVVMPARTMLMTGGMTRPAPRPERRSTGVSSQLRRSTPTASTTARVAAMPIVTTAVPTDRMRTPMRPARLLEAAEAMTVPMANGSIVMPARRGLMAKPSWRKRPETKKKQLSPPKKTIWKTTPETKARSAASDAWTIGDRSSALLRRSVSAKAANTGMDAPSMAQPHAGHPSCRPCTRGKTTRNTPSVARKAPGRSRRGASGARESGTRRRAPTTAKMPMGTLT